MMQEIIGFLAGFLFSISLVPQLIKSCKTKKVEDVSLLMLFIMALATALWVVYGVFITSYPLIFMDSFGFLVNVYLIFVKIKYQR